MSKSVWKIWKYRLPTSRPEFEIDMVAGVTLSLQLQDGDPVLWSAVCTSDDDDKPYPHKFVWVMTGRPIPDSVKMISQDFVGTVQRPDGIVLHLFQLTGMKA